METESFGTMKYVFQVYMCTDVRLKQPLNHYMFDSVGSATNWHSNYSRLSIDPIPRHISTLSSIASYLALNCMYLSQIPLDDH